MRGPLRFIFAHFPVRPLTLAALGAWRAAGRLASAMRGAALFPNAEGLFCHWSVEIKYPENIVLGRDVILGPGSTLGAKAQIRLGDHVRLSKDVVVETAGLDFGTRTTPYEHIASPIDIGEGVWIGARAMILGGVTIGAHAVVAAGSIVTRDVPPRAVVGGVPAKVLTPRGPAAGLETKAG